MKIPYVKILSYGLAFSFIYSAISSLVNPQNWIGFIPIFIENIISLETFLIIFSIFEIALGVWIITNWKINYSSLVALITLIFLIVFNLISLDIIYRDIPILGIALFLFLNSKKLL